MLTPMVRHLLDPWLRELKAAGRSRETLRAYRRGVEEYFSLQEDLTKAGVIDYLAELSDRGVETATARLRLAAVKQFAKWLENEGYDTLAIRTIQAPKMMQKPVPDLTPDEIRAMMAACNGNDIRSRRDKAALGLFSDTGMRAGELLNLDLPDLDLDRCTALVRRTKNGEPRRVKFTPQTAVLLDRYLRVRGPQPFDDVFVGRTRPLDYAGLVATLKKRAESAGVRNFHPHRFRHSMAVRWLKAGGSETGLQAQAGWRDRAMIARYVKTAAQDIAGEEFDRLNIGV